ncbi:aspartyl/glutamyl-tRNA amidotransferase subunit C [Patescibacteria group bacterium]|nr:aspartyl/glutamyl-tRNA amidotransferase subunit C [Patescibacteria group bacterium]
MALSQNDVLHISKLCNLALSSEEIEKLSQMLSETIDYIAVLDELDTSKVAETYQVTGLTNVFQVQDSTSNTLTQAEALSNAHEAIKNMFATKAVFDRH